MSARQRFSTSTLVVPIAAIAAACAHGSAGPASKATAAAAASAPPAADLSPTSAPPPASADDDPKPPTDDGVAACRSLGQAYAVARDRVDVDAYAALFSDDAEFVFQENKVQGPAAITALMQERAEGTVTRHLMTTAHYDAVDADTVQGISYFLVFSESPKNDVTRPLASSGPRAVIEYHDRCTKTDDGWKIGRREVKLVFVPASRR